MKELRVGIIGFGYRSRHVFCEFGKLEDGRAEVKLAAISDPKTKEELLAEAQLSNLDLSETHFYTDEDEMMDQEQLDGIIIGTRCSLHTKLAIKVLKRKIPLFLEKPVSTTEKDWNLLREAYEQYGGEVVVSFPLRLSSLSLEAKRIIDSGEIGTVQHVAAFNYVTYGGDYYHDWYRDERETGGLFLQKATHDFDYIHHILGIRPVEICAMNSKQVMKGDKPAGLKCEDCPERNTCCEGPFSVAKINGDYIHGPYCCFAEDTGNEDSGTAIVRYETGMHMVYTQNFFVRNQKAAKRGAIFAGDLGTLEFDWNTCDIIIRKNYIPGEMKYHVSMVGKHGGGDFKLAANFVGVMLGEEHSLAPMEQGLFSAHMCLQARESAASHRFLPITYYR